MKKPKFDYDKVMDRFDKVFMMNGMILADAIKSSITEEGMPFIRELGSKIKNGYEKIDKIVSGLDDEDFQTWYAARINGVRPYLQMLKETTEMVDTDNTIDRLIALKKAYISIPTTLSMLRAFEETFLMAGLIKY